MKNKVCAGTEVLDLRMCRKIYLLLWTVFHICFVNNTLKLLNQLLGKLFCFLNRCGKHKLIKVDSNERVH